MSGIIFDIKEMAVHDGPGLRTTVFFKGCPLHCRWCHNPEGISKNPQLMFKKARCKNCGLCKIKCSHPECEPFGRCLHACPDNLLSVAGRKTDAKELAAELKKSAEPLEDDFGGFTFSGGEPLFQPDFLLELIDNLEGYHLCIETSGFADSEIFKKVIEKLDFIIMDLKLADNEAHKKYTGAGNNIILKNFEILQKSGKPHLIRTPLIPGITDTPENLAKLKAIIGSDKWEQLPYNTMTGAKYQMLGIDYELKI